mgnify:FL=1
MSTANIILMIAASVAVTFFLRILPFFAFSGDRKMPEWLDRLGQALPPAIMAVLIVYCLKDVPYDLKNAAVPKLLGVAATVISYRFKHNSLISLVSGTAVYMLMIRLI